jgi:Domain of unknown function (DUF4390)
LSSRRLFLAAGLLAALPSAAQVARLVHLQLQRAEEGLRLAYTAQLELPRAMDDALHKGVPLYFVAQAELTRSRWYWRDALVARSRRQWRVSFQALSRQYRVSTGGLHQSHDSLSDALNTVSRSSAWPLELREEPLANASYELRFVLKLDTSQLPGPLQIGLGPLSGLGLERVQAVAASDLYAPPLPTASPPASS